MFDGYYNAFWFLVIGVIFVALNLWISSLIRPSDPHAEKLLPYECGEESSGTGFVLSNLGRGLADREASINCKACLATALVTALAASIVVTVTTPSLSSGRPTTSVAKP